MGNYTDSRYILGRMEVHTIVNEKRKH